ncbi:F-box protein At5g07610-like [Lotus japonicus]|uniref:F-box protein At5g07610-like n=1 Tax=Lotus japonicus TaxID=34305 RepID=UPI00258A18B7|nr:F-box protein At5g07610-like [Lotus japonicus]
MKGVSECGSLVQIGNAKFKFKICRGGRRKHRHIDDSNEIVNIYLAFDPSISPYYKVISVAQQLLGGSWVFHEYSFQTRSWISAGAGVSSPTQLSLKGARAKCVYCNRAIHWCRKSEFSMYFNVDTLRLIKHWRMPLSDSEWVNRDISYFGESGGRLHLAVTYAKQTLIYDIFELKEDYSGWSLKHRVDLNPLRHMYEGLSNCVLTIVGPVNKEKSLLVLLASATEGTLVVYDPVTSRN